MQKTSRRVLDPDAAKSSDIVGTLGGMYVERRGQSGERGREELVREDGEDRGARHAR
jgi:hypothetical protein